MKIIWIFCLKIFNFSVINFSVYLNRHVFVMETHKRTKTGDSVPSSPFIYSNVAREASYASQPFNYPAISQNPSKHSSIAGRDRPVTVADRPITARCRFINASWDKVGWKLMETSVYSKNWFCKYCINTPMCWTEVDSQILQTIISQWMWNVIITIKMHKKLHEISVLVFFLISRVLDNPSSRFLCHCSHEPCNKLSSENMNLIWVIWIQIMFLVNWNRRALELPVCPHTIIALFRIQLMKSKFTFEWTFTGLTVIPLLRICFYFVDILSLSDETQIDTIAAFILVLDTYLYVLLYCLELHKEIWVVSRKN